MNASAYAHIAFQSVTLQPDIYIYICIYIYIYIFRIHAKCSNDLNHTFPISYLGTLASAVYIYMYIYMIRDIFSTSHRRHFHENTCSLVENECWGLCTVDN